MIVTTKYNHYDRTHKLAVSRRRRIVNNRRPVDEVNLFQGLTEAELESAVESKPASGNLVSNLAFNLDE